MSKQTIWNFLKLHTSLSDEAIAGIMGNMEAESNCEACRLQGDFTSDRRTSKQYASDVNNGRMTVNQFMNDAKGWGLCQWTYNQRKLNLLNSCKSYPVGIEDESAQLAFFLAEFQNEYPNAWKMLLNTNNIYDAARIICVEYERPAVNNVAARAEYGNEIYKQFHGKEIPTTTPTTTPTTPTTTTQPPNDKLCEALNLLIQAVTLLKEAILNG